MVSMSLLDEFRFLPIHRINVRPHCPVAFVGPEFINADCDACGAERRCTCVALRYLVALFACLIGNGSES